VIATYDSSNVRIYVNGVEQASAQAVGMYAASGTNSLVVGWRTYTSIVGGWNGLVDELRVYNRAISAIEALNLYNQGITKIGATEQASNFLNSGLVGYWPFNGKDVLWSSDTAGTVYDRSGSGLNGSFSGFSKKMTPIAGKVGQAFKLNNSGVVVGDNNALDIPDNVTVSLWLRPDAETVGYSSNPLTKWSGTSDANYVLYYFGTTSGESKNLRFYANAGGTWKAVSSSYMSTLGKWTHVTWTYNSSLGGQLYINGSSYGSRVGSGVLATNAAGLGIGAINGATDEVRIYNRELSANEIKALYRSGQSVVKK
jgi:hypothetical protein